MLCCALNLFLEILFTWLRNRQERHCHWKMQLRFWNLWNNFIHFSSIETGRQIHCKTIHWQRGYNQKTKSTLNMCQMYPFGIKAHWSWTFILNIVVRGAQSFVNCFVTFCIRLKSALNQGQVTYLVHYHYWDV